MTNCKTCGHEVEPDTEHVERRLDGGCNIVKKGTLYYVRFCHLCGQQLNKHDIVYCQSRRIDKLEENQKMSGIVLTIFFVILFVLNLMRLL